MVKRDIVYRPFMRRYHFRFAILLGMLSLVALGTFFLSGCGSAHGESASRRPLIVLDAGHGGRDPGAVCDGVHEADINLAMLKSVSDLLWADERLAVKATRTLDIYVTLQDRIAVANDADAALYLSIQSNACEYPDVTGVETLVSDAISEGDPSWQFAEILQDAVTHATGARDRGVRAQDLYLHRAEMPAALIEVGFLTNDEERARLLEPTYHQAIAQAICDGIITYLDYADPSFGDL